jgi:hypothetical protein
MYDSETRHCNQGANLNWASEPGVKKAGLEVILGFALTEISENAVSNTVIQIAEI